MNKTQAIRKFNEEYTNLKEGEKRNSQELLIKCFKLILLLKEDSDANDYRMILAFKEVFEAFLL